MHRHTYTDICIYTEEKDIYTIGRFVNQLILTVLHAALSNTNELWHFGVITVKKNMCLSHITSSAVIEY